MKKYILLILIVGVVFNACKNPFQKEVNEVEDLLLIMGDVEKTLLSIDTSAVFSTKRKMATDLAEFYQLKDTLTREEAFKLDDIFGSKKKLYRLTSNYANFINQIEISRTQLTNLKQDLENEVIKKEDYLNYYMVEKKSLMTLNNQINKSINGIETVIDKYELDRPDLLNMIERKKLKVDNHE